MYSVLLNKFSVQAMFEEGALSTFSSALKKQLFDSMFQVRAHVVQSEKRLLKIF